MKARRCVVLGVITTAVCHTAAAGVILFEGFNQASVPAGWTVSNPAPLTFVTSSFNPAASPYEGTHFVKFDSFNYSSGTRSTLTSPAVATLGRTNVVVRFAWHRDPGYSNAQDRVIVQWSLNGATWTNAGTFLRYASTTGWTLQSVALPGAATNQPVLYIRFEFISAYGNNCYLDAVRIEGAMPGEVDPPAAFSATSVGTSINLLWQTNSAGDAVMIASNTAAAFGVPSNGVEYAVGSELPGGGGILYQGGGTALSVSNLPHATRFYFRAWSVNGLTNYSDPVNADALTDFVLPIYQGFNSSQLPAGWSISNTTYLTLVSSSTYPTAVPYEGTHFVSFRSYYAQAGTRATLTSPRFSSQGGLAAIFVDFAWHQDPGYADDNDSMSVQWSSNGTQWVSAQTFYRVAPQTGWTVQRVRLPAAALGHPQLQVRFNFLSAYGNNCYLDDVGIIGATTGVYLSPTSQRGASVPGKSVTYPLSLLNLSGSGQNVLLTYSSTWPANGPAATGVIPNDASTNISVSVQIPANAIDSQSCTTIVQAVTADAQFTNTAVLITTCQWVIQPVCEWFEAGLGFWTNYFAGGVNGGWYWDSWFSAAAHDQETGGTNWLVSPAIDLNHPWAPNLLLSFWFGTDDELLVPEGVYLVTGDRNPMVGSAVRLADIQYEPNAWQYNEVDLTSFVTNVPVYLAFEYISTNPWQLLTGICIDASKTGIDDAILHGPAMLPAMTSYATTVAITGGLYVAGASGPSGPVVLATAEVGFGPQGIAPNEAEWTWFPATYLGVAGDYDLFTATPHLTLAGALNYCYRFRRGNAPWVYGDLDGSSNGFNTNKLGTANVAMLPPQGALLRAQTISLNYNFGPSSFSDPTLDPPMYYETADDLRLPYDAVITAVRLGGDYWYAGRQNLEQGFWLRIYVNAVTNPGSLLYEQYVPGYACETLLGIDAWGNYIYKYHVSLATQLYVQAGQTHWISLQHAVQRGTRWSLLDTPDNIRDFPACQRPASSGTWNIRGFDLGMEVYGVATNAGYLDGTVLDAESSAPIQGAQVLITNAAYVTVLATDSNGYYHTAVPAGTYNITVTKANYLPATAHGVVVSLGATTTMNFFLEGSRLHVTPTNITRTMLLNTQTVNPLVLSNTGPLPVQFSLTIRNMGAATTLAARITRVSIPPSDGNFPRSSAPLSAGRAPQSSGSAPLAPAAPAALALLSSAVKAYGFNIYPASPNALISLMTDNPGAYSTIGTANTGSGGFVCGAAFLNGDFSKLYCLLYQINKLVTVNTLNAAVTEIAPCAPPSGESWTGLAAAPDGTLYASSYGSVSKLYQLNPTTAAYTLVGEITSGELIIGIAINAAGEMYGLDLANDTLVRINRATGAGTVIGSIGFDANYAQDLAFDHENNVLYLAAYNNTLGRGELRVADTTTGNSVLIGPFGTTATEVDGFETMTALPAIWARAETNAGAIAAGDARTVNITFDASVVSNVGEYLAELLLQGTFVNQVAPVPLKMIVATGPVIRAPSVLNFGEVVVGENTNLPLVVENIGVGVLTGQITGVTAPFAVAGSDSYIIPQGGSSPHTVTFSPGIEGTYTNIAVLTGGGGATVTLLGSGIPEPALWLTGLVFGLCACSRRR